MSTMWNKNPSQHDRLNESSTVEVINWIEGVIRYVGHQLKYLHDKSNTFVQF